MSAHSINAPRNSGAGTKIIQCCLFPSNHFVKSSQYTLHSFIRESFDGCEEAAGFNDLLITIGEIPSNNDTGLAAADDSSCVKLKLEDPCHTCRLSVNSCMVMAMTVRNWMDCSLLCTRSWWDNSALALRLHLRLRCQDWDNCRLPINWIGRLSLHLRC